MPLSLAAIFYFARIIEQTLRDVPRGVIEAAEAMGASPLQIVTQVLLVEARSGLILAVTITAVSFLSYSAVAGVVGGGGIGDLAIRYGYYRFQTDVDADHHRPAGGAGAGHPGSSANGWRGVWTSAELSRKPF